MPDERPEPLGPRHREVERLRRLLQQASARREEGAFAVEGPKLLTAALDAGVELEAAYVAEGADGFEALLARLDAAAVPVRTLRRGVIDRVADAATPQPVIGIARSRVVRSDGLAAALRGLDFVVVAVDVQDPGNAGTLMRSAEAAGAGAVLFAGASVDPLHPKTVRASAGSVFQVTVVDGGEPEAMLELLGAQGLVRLGAAVGGGACDDLDLTRPVALVLGNEAHGLPAGLPLDGTVSVPMAGRAESLNVAMAGSILCYEVGRQRRAAGRG